MTSAATHICYLNSTQVIPIQFLLIKSMLEETVGTPYPYFLQLANVHTRLPFFRAPTKSKQNMLIIFDSQGGVKCSAENSLIL